MKQFDAIMIGTGQAVCGMSPISSRKVCPGSAVAGALVALFSR